ncbi:MCE family protein, partial [Nocardioides sp. GCM10030258]
MGRQLSELRRHKGAVAGVAVFTLVAVVLTAMVSGTLSRAQRGDAITVTAVFRDATGLRAGDDVRVSGVRVGRVTETRVGTGKERGLAVVTMNVAADQVLHEDITASIDYLNLMGQRYVDLTRADRTADAARLADGDRIPLERTRPALDLTAMFNAFEPIFELLQPGDLNQLATNIVQVLQGQGPTIEHLLEQTADLTSGLVDREDTLARVVDNVTLVLQTTNDHRTELSELVHGLDSLTSGLASDRDRI